MRGYARFRSENLILRDELAIDRTLLANERTLLAYLRTGLALMIAGATIIHFAESFWFLATGVACVPLGLLCSIIGFQRFDRVRKAIRPVRRTPRSRTPGG